MKELKVELLKFSKKIGDQGDTALQQKWIDNFLAAAQQYLTPEAIRSFTPLDLRVLYVIWLEKYVETASFEAASETLLRHIEITTEPREMVAKKPSGTNVKSIFKH
jgi:hypothetical protein